MKFIYYKNRKVVISLDYDCCGEVLFADGIVDGPIKKNTLLKFFEKITNQAPTIELRVGSLRQDEDVDLLNHNRLKNGLCISNYKKFSKEKDWQFVEPHIRYYFSEYFDQPTNVKKLVIVKNQLEDVSHSYPDQYIDYYFIDDDYPSPESRAKKSIFQTLIEELPEWIPHNVIVHIYRYDCFNEVAHAEVKPIAVLQAPLSANNARWVRASVPDLNEYIRPFNLFYNKTKLLNMGMNQGDAACQKAWDTEYALVPLKNIPR